MPLIKSLLYLKKQKREERKRIRKEKKTKNEANINEQAKDEGIEDV